MAPLRSSLLRWGKAEIQAVLAAEYWSQVHTEKEIGRVGRKLVSKTRDCVLKAVTSSRRLQLVHQMSHLCKPWLTSTAPLLTQGWSAGGRGASPCTHPVGAVRAVIPPLVTALHRQGKKQEQRGANRSSYFYGKTKKQLEKSYGQANS